MFDFSIEVSNKPERAELDLRRTGKLVIAESFIHEGWIPEAFYKLQLTVVRCEFVICTRHLVEYVCVSPRMRCLPVGECIPEYQIVVSTTWNGTRTYELEEVIPGAPAQQSPKNNHTKGSNG